MINTICSIIILTLYGALVNRIRGRPTLVLHRINCNSVAEVAS